MHPGSWAKEVRTRGGERMLEDPRCSEGIADTGVAGLLEERERKTVALRRIWTPFRYRIVKMPPTAPG